MTDPHSVRPGWYAAGISNEERWWDGAAWTDHYRSAVPLPTSRIQWGGNATASLVVGIIVLVMAVPTFGFAILSLILGDGGGVFLNLLAGGAFAVLGGLGVANSVGLKRQQAAAIAHERQRHTPPTT